MAKQSLEGLSETMFYVLLALLRQPRCGIEISSYVETITYGQVKIGPGTLYTILGRFVEEELIEEISVEGRKRTYKISDKGIRCYLKEKTRIYRMIEDAEREERL